MSPSPIKLTAVPTRDVDRVLPLKDIQIAEADKAYLVCIIWQIVNTSSLISKSPTSLTLS